MADTPHMLTAAKIPVRWETPVDAWNHPLDAARLKSLQAGAANWELRAQRSDSAGWLAARLRSKP